MSDSPEVPPVPTDNIFSLTDFLSRKYKPKECRHQRLEVDDNNRKITCKDCSREIEPFEACLMLANRASDYQQTYDSMRKQHRDLASWVPHRRTVRSLESMWRSNRLPMCPYCKKGVTAEELASMGWVHKAYAEAVARDTLDKPSADVVPIENAEQPNDEAGP